MRCAWKAFIKLLPLWLGKQVDKFGEVTSLELRLRIGRAPEMICVDGRYSLDGDVTAEDLHYCVNAATRYSPWCCTTLEHGYITASGGHRIGVCGDVVLKEGKMSTITNLTSLCIRIARDFQGISTGAVGINGNLLIIGRPGCGKTTFLRDLIRQMSNLRENVVAVVDERRELFPVLEGKFVFSPGCRTEVVTGCRKSAGIEILLRTMNPDVIAVDEITSNEDSEALVQACRCGVSMMATAHAGNIQDFLKRPVYQRLIQDKVFDTIIVLQPDRTWTLVRMEL